MYCGHVAQSKFDAMQTMMGRCRHMLHDLRRAKCAGSKDKSVLQALRTDLECDVFSSAVTHRHHAALTSTLGAVMVIAFLFGRMLSL